MMNPEKINIHPHVLDSLVGNRVRIVGDHPHSGCSGEIVRIAESPWGKRPVVKLDEPHMGISECFIMKSKNAAKELRGKRKS